MSFIACAHFSFDHRVNLDLGLLVSFFLGIVMSAASTTASVSRYTAVFIVLQLRGFSGTNWEYEFVTTLGRVPVWLLEISILVTCRIRCFCSDCTSALLVSGH